MPVSPQRYFAGLIARLAEEPKNPTGCTFMISKKPSALVFVLVRCVSQKQGFLVGMDLINESLY